MRPTVFLTLLLTFLCTCASAQKTYFQQEVNYAIDARLDDKKHELHAHLKLTYTNNSPNPISIIPFHLWPRAFSSDATDFAKQQLRNGNTRFHFSDRSSRGTLDSLSFTMDGKAADFQISGDAPDIADVLLPAVIPPGGTAVIETPFRIKIPASFSRLGHVGQSYQMTQWYPKPAVYDHNGWHPMPYLDQGEFFSEFGDFTVRLTLPENYVVGATGVVQEEKERNWLLAKAETDRTNLARAEAAGKLNEGYVNEPYPASSPQMKTVTWKGERVHDFAWFADKRFRILHDTLQLPDRTKAVDVWAMFTATEASLWTKAADYLKRSTRFYSEQIGTYPYPQVTGVQSALSAGGGMEYPMITVIGLSGNAAVLDDVLAHEVGHNWFYGILASNERDHPWMDEGLNSFYEHRYMAKFWPERARGVEILGRSIDYDHLGYRYLARQGKDQAPDTRSDSLSKNNYWVQAYSKPALALEELESLAGTEAFDRAMKAYYEAWSFRHPQPEDFFRVINENLELETEPWFSEALMTTKTSDIVVKSETKQKGLRIMPPAVEPLALDLYPGNDNFTKKKLAIGLVTDQEKAGKHQLFLAPLVGFNEHDGPLLGLAVHNRTLEPKNLEFIIAPMFGFESKKLSGFIGTQQRIPFQSGTFQQFKYKVGLQKFSDFTLRRTDEPYSYTRLAGEMELSFRHAPITEVSSSFVLQLTALNQDRPDFDNEGMIMGSSKERNSFVRATYRRGKDKELTPFGYGITLEYKIADDQTAFNDNHLKIEVELNGGYQYEQNRFLRYRFFGGVFLANELRESAVRSNSGFSLVDNAFSNYRYDDLYLGRNLGGIYGQQVEQRQGGFRAPISSSFAFGMSNSYMTAVNIDADLPALPAYLPLGLFLDAGYYGFKSLSAEPLNGELSWVGGISLTAMKGQVGLFVPLIADPDTKLLLEQRGDLLERATFRLNLAGWMPWRWVDDLF
ncbi:MAG: hypothetical protein ACI974_000478 [Paraglaciecola sp.]|jgi:hypothetical protein